VLLGKDGFGRRFHDRRQSSKPQVGFHLLGSIDQDVDDPACLPHRSGGERGRSEANRSRRPAASKDQRVPLPTVACQDTFENLVRFDGTLDLDDVSQISPEHVGVPLERPRRRVVPVDDRRVAIGDGNGMADCV
jgi:hypothetical protein